MMPMLEIEEIALRLCVASVAGAMIGLNRDLKGKPAGLRTHSLVAMGSALVILASFDFAAGEAADANAVSRAIQGVITGIGFLGAGVIVKDAAGERVHGLTTAATIWLTACIGIVCGLGAWKVAIAAIGLIMLVLVAGGPLERFIHAKFGGEDEEPDPAEESE